MTAPMDPFAFNLRHLRAVAAAARCGTVSAAAAEVNLSQPAVTQGVAKIEAQLGLSLFERSAAGMTPTEAGNLLAARIDAAEAAMRRAFAPSRRAPVRQVTAAQWRAILALADSGSFVGAAQATGISQPSLHRAVRDLEGIARRPLVERRGRGVALTRDGQHLVRGFRLALGELRTALEELAALAGRDSFWVRIGAMPLARAGLLPIAAARFHARHPHTRIEMIEGSHAELIERLRDGSLDFLVGALRDPEPGPDVAQKLLFEDRLVILCGSQHPLARTRRPTIAQLARFPWIIAREGTPLRAHWRAMFAGLKHLPSAPIVSGSAMAIRTLLTEGDFLTLLSPEQVRLDLELGRITALPAPVEAPRRRIGTTIRADWRPTAPQKAFLALLETIARRDRDEARLLEIE